MASDTKHKSCHIPLISYQPQPHPCTYVHLALSQGPEFILITCCDSIMLKPPGFNENGQKSFSSAPEFPACMTDAQQGEYEKHCCITCGCEVSGTEVGSRDEETGGFALKYWAAHCLKCSIPGQSSSDLVEVHVHPTKRRRAQCTEEESINYLRADPYVAQFEAYSVLCACCNKWIRLRLNSTFCSIPWDAHRKSCLAKKVSPQNSYMSNGSNIEQRVNKLRYF